MTTIFLAAMLIDAAVRCIMLVQLEDISLKYVPVDGLCFF